MRKNATEPGRARSAAAANTHCAGIVSMKMPAIAADAIPATDAPTRIRAGSHRDVASVLGPDPVGMAEMGRIVDDASAQRPVVHATGEPGDMYLLHPFTVHAADEHRGRTPRFMAQSPVVLTAPLTPATSSSLGCVWDT